MMSFYRNRSLSLFFNFVFLFYCMVSGSRWSLSISIMLLSDTDDWHAQWHIMYWMACLHSNEHSLVETYEPREQHSSFFFFHYFMFWRNIWEVEMTNMLLLTFDPKLIYASDMLIEFPPKSVCLRKPFGVEPWICSEEDVGNLLMVRPFASFFLKHTVHFMYLILRRWSSCLVDSGVVYLYKRHDILRFNFYLNIL